ncbi:MAG: 7,8-didemethyl-8-hydroxy-5-deazariboflavin synthase subunit CofG [Methanothrix sp.]|uniref:7,8-didemethyl-8-hydroxy-5-deazariboflavin synthase subunit CofG n=1 Tax=Methanothrix sp. TaxID=90426 RepID=UPI00247C9DC5|nr:7,8-didemethyl-8-hydroxy-5-deazariboflavin synthase subunit CofG [Methanothrix sp.]
MREGIHAEARRAEALRATFSRNVFIPVTDLCRNACGYCSFRRDPDRARVISRSDALRLMDRAQRAGCSEALFTMGDRPWEVRGNRLELLEYLIELCELALERDLLPHTNAGILTREELELLAPYNASMGLMLESTAHLKIHERSPGKRPEVRVRTISDAGELRIPFTTGILVGIGESSEDRMRSLEAIAELHREHGHIQEVIIQPLDPKPGTESEGMQPPPVEDLEELVHIARRILPPEISIQVPPNLVDPVPLLRAGADDLGGISPVTPDWINPERRWPEIDELRGIVLVERLPVYPRYVKLGWYGSRTKELVRQLADERGLRKTGSFYTHTWE